MHNKESFNQIPDQLLAENQRLIHLLNKLSGFVPDSSDSDDSMRLPSFLPLAISQILIGEQSFNERIEQVLNHLGDFTAVSRVYIFEDFEDGLSCCNTYEWCNAGVESQKKALYNINYRDVPSWKEILEENGSIESPDIEKLPADILKVLLSQGIKSILVFPLTSGSKFIGFIGFDECSFHRPWTEMEKALLATAARLIGNAYQQNFSISQIKNSLQVRQFLFDIAFHLHQQGTLNETLGPVALKMIQTWDLEGFAIYSSSSDNNAEFGIVAKAFANGYDTAFPETVFLPDHFILPLIPNDKTALLDSNNQNYEMQLSALGFPVANSYVTGIRTHNGPNGLMVFKWPSTMNTSPVDVQIMDTLGSMISRYIDHRKADAENRIKHEQILEINQQLAHKENFLNNIILAAPIGILLIKDRIIQYVNDRIIQSSLYPREELIGLHISKLYAEGNENIESVNNFYSEIVRNGISSMEVGLKRKDNSILYYQIVGTPGPDFEKDKSFLLVCQDVTEIRNIETSLNESEERNVKIIEANIDGIFIISEKGELVYANKTGCDMSGFTRAEMGNMALNQLFPENSGKDYLKIVEQLNRGGDYRGESQLSHRSGSILYVELHGTRIVLDGKPHYYFSIHDITRRKQNEAALRVSEKKFRSLSENLPDCVLRINRSGLVTFSNSLFITTFMPKENDIVSRHIFHIEELPDDFVKGFLPALNFVLNRREIFHLEIEHLNSGEEIVFDWTLSPEIDENGHCVSILGIGRDITSRKKVERELLFAKERAEAADRLKSAFLANMSHEIRTPLNAIVGFSNLLGETDPESADREEFVSLINKSADNLMALINDIIDIAKIESGHMVINKKAVNVYDILDAVYNTYQKRVENQFGGRVELRLSVPDEVKPTTMVDADQVRLLQILNNLLDNAIKFMNEGYIELGCTLENQQLRFFVLDTGIGIAAENQKMVFEAFRQEEESTSKKYGGTGLGLSICKKLVEAMSGQMGLKSEKGKGSEFFFYLNLHTSISVSLPSVAAEEDTIYTLQDDELPVSSYPDWSHRMLLLVYENSSVHMLMKKHLEKTGITILSARSGAAARRLLLTRRDIDVTIMDYRLPDGNALDFIRSLRSASIQVPLIVQTECHNELVVKELMAAGVNDCISASIASLDLITKLRVHINVPELVK